MNFANVKEWVIPEGDVKKVVDSQNRIIWHKDTYTILPYLIAPYGSGTLIPIQIPVGYTYEIGMTHMYMSNSITTNDMVYPMSGIGNLNPYFRIRVNVHNYYRTYRLLLPSPLTSAATSEQARPSSNTATNWYKPSVADLYKKQTIILSNSACSVKIYNNPTDTTPATTKNNNDINSSWAWNKNSAVDGYWCFGGVAVYNSNDGYYVGVGQQGMNSLIYDAWININGTIKTYKPAIRDKTGEVGFFDEDNNEFYPSASVNEFYYVPIIATGLTLSGAQVPIGGTVRISRTFSPSTTSNQTCTWESSNPAVATVDSDGVVTGVSYGNVTITATTTDGSDISASCNVLCYIPTTGITIYPSSGEVPLNGTKTWYYEITPNNATFKTVTWEKVRYSGSSGNVDLSKNSDQSCDVTGTVLSDADRVQIRAKAYNGQYSNIAYVRVTENTVPVTSVSLNKTSVSIGIDGTVQLIATVNPSDATYTGIGWSSNNSSIATVSSAGLVTGVSAGVATITASVGGKTATCSVTVTPPAELESITIAPHSATLVTGSTKQLNITSHTPSNAGTITYTWNSSNTSVATVSSTGLVTAVSTGYAVISCTGHGYNNSVAVDSCAIAVTSASTPKYTLTVTGPSGSNVIIDGYGNGTGSASATDFDGTTISYSVQKTGYTTVTGSWTLNGADKTVSVTLNQIHVSSVSLNKNSVTLGVNGTETLIATVTPSNALNKSISWSSSNTNIATVNQSGKITAKAAGTAVITVTTADGGYTATCNVTVVGNYTLYVNGPSGSVVRINGTVTNSMTAANGTTLSYEVTKDYYNTVSGSWTLNGADKTINVTLSPIAVTGVSLNKSTLALSAGNTSTLIATVTPSNALDTHVKWTSSNTSAATVSNSGSWVGPGSQTITGVALGTTVITVTTSDGGYTATCNVTVSQSGDPGKSLTIANNTGFEIKYGKANNESTMSTLGSGNVANVTLTSGESLYILRSYSGTTINLSCLSEYSIASGSYRIIYANAIDGETIHAVVTG